MQTAGSVRARQWSWSGGAVVGRGKPARREQRRRAVRLCGCGSGAVELLPGEVKRARREQRRLGRGRLGCGRGEGLGLYRGLGRL